MTTPTDSFEGRVKEALEELLPAMTSDGGGAELAACAYGRVEIVLVGSCVFCPSQKLSAEALRRGLKSRVPEAVEIQIRASRDRAAPNLEYVAVLRRAS